MYNKQIRAAVKEHHVYLWQVAERLGIQDSALSRKLRRELPSEEQKQILEIILAIAEEVRRNDAAGSEC